MNRKESRMLLESRGYKVDRMCILKDQEYITSFNQDQEVFLCYSVDDLESENRIPHLLDLQRLCDELQIPYETRRMEEARDILTERHEQRARTLQVLNHLVSPSKKKPEQTPSED